MTSFHSERIGPDPHLAVDHVGSGDVVVFLHGIGGNRTNWRDQLPSFGKHFLAVALDARGYGDSDDYEGPLDFASYADDVVRVLSHFRVERAHVVGLSMGGRVAMDLALRHPSAILTLTLCDTHKGFANFSAEQRAEFVRLRKEPLLQGKEPRDIAETVARSLVSPQASPEALQRLVASMSRLHKASYIKSIEASVYSDGLSGLERIGVPTHVIVGAEDRLTPPEMARELADEIPGAVLTVIEGAGHLVNIEMPDAFNQAALRFLLAHGRR